MQRHRKQKKRNKWITKRWKDAQKAEAKAAAAS